MDKVFAIVRMLAEPPKKPRGGLIRLEVMGSEGAGLSGKSGF
jgi:hypothetical protein